EGFEEGLGDPDDPSSPDELSADGLSERLLEVRDDRRPEGPVPVNCGRMVSWKDFDPTVSWRESDGPSKLANSCPIKERPDGRIPSSNNNCRRLRSKLLVKPGTASKVTGTTVPSRDQ